MGKRSDLLLNRLLLLNDGPHRTAGIGARISLSSTWTLSGSPGRGVVERLRVQPVTSPWGLSLAPGRLGLVRQGSQSIFNRRLSFRRRPRQRSVNHPLGVVKLALQLDHILLLRQGRPERRLLRQAWSSGHAEDSARSTLKASPSRNRRPKPWKGRRT